MTASLRCVALPCETLYLYPRILSQSPQGIAEHDDGRTVVVVGCAERCEGKYGTPGAPETQMSIPDDDGVFVWWHVVWSLNGRNLRNTWIFD